VPGLPLVQCFVRPAPPQLVVPGTAVNRSRVGGAVEVVVELLVLVTVELPPPMVVDVVAPVHGSGLHVPGPTFVPPAVAQSSALSTVHVKLPATEPAWQHWIGLAIDVDVDVEVLVLVVDTVLHGSGVHVPGPTFAPPALPHAAAVSMVQVKAPPGEDEGTQHCTGPGIDVDVEDDVDVEVLLELVTLLEVDVLVDVLVVDAPLHGSGEHVPGPTFDPPALPHAAAVSTVQVKAPPADEGGRQHWICPINDVDVVLVVEVVVIEVDALVDVLVVVDVVVVDAPLQALALHSPGPMSTPPSVAHCAGDTDSHTRAPIALSPTQQRVGGC